jgi:FtsP/CotA-like multicopper oxidase with cupredoxin domain
MAPGEVVRLRLLNGTNSLLMPLQLPGFTVYVIGIDGVNLVAPYQVPAGANIPTASGNRVELLIQAPATPGTYTLASQATNVFPGSDPSTAQWPAFNLLQIAVSGQPVSMGIPSSLPAPSRVYPFLAGGYAQSRSVTFSAGANPSTSILTGTDLLVNSQAYRESSVLFNLPVGTTDQWTVSNSMNQGHPFHIHTNTLQVMSVQGASPLIPTPYLADTVWIPPSGSVTFLMRYVQWHGKAVFHCHKLPHEDQGMMANIMYA